MSMPSDEPVQPDQAHRDPLLGEVPLTVPESVPNTCHPSEAPEEWRDPDLPRVTGYDVLSVLGRGGMGVVYKARHLALKRIVALKMILGTAGDEARSRFTAEAEAIARLQHPNIVQIYEVSHWQPQEGGSPLPYCSLEFVTGGSLDGLIRGVPQSPSESAALVRTLALAVHAAHGKNIIHRDLKPQNVLLASEGLSRDNPFVRLIRTIRLSGSGIE